MPVTGRAWAAGSRRDVTWAVREEKRLDLQRCRRPAGYVRVMRERHVQDALLDDVPDEHACSLASF
ncbi:hypothetical protein GCM10010299_78370 [Streptomyces tanashiensis]|nr:hypothetical protein GCM10010299_78370 [Streptomyces tanashiensis]